MLATILLILGIACLIAFWMFLVPHYNGTEYTLGIGSSYSPIAQYQALPKAVSVAVPEPTVPTAPTVPEKSQKKRNFIPSENFKGGKPGYVFKKDKQGIGYYRDRHVSFNESENEVRLYNTGDPPVNTRHTQIV